MDPAKLGVEHTLPARKFTTHAFINGSDCFGRRVAANAREKHGRGDREFVFPRVGCPHRLGEITVAPCAAAIIRCRDELMLPAAGEPA